MTYNQNLNKSSTASATTGAGDVHPSGAPEFLPLVLSKGVEIYHSLYDICHVIDING
jgi:hypothetical protein